MLCRAMWSMGNVVRSKQISSFNEVLQCIVYQTIEEAEALKKHVLVAAGNFPCQQTVYLLPMEAQTLFGTEDDAVKMPSDAPCHKCVTG